MMTLKNSIIKKVCFFSGALLIVAGVLILALWQLNIHNSIQKSDEYVKTIRALTPTPQGAALEQKSNNTMPVLSVDGTDFAGVIEIPRFNSALPVCDSWGSVTKYPCKLNGSVYDKTIQIGATTQKGQYDFYRKLSVGDTVEFCDMEGNRFTYTITNLNYRDNADKATLTANKSALTLFIKNVYDFNYLIVCCN